MRWYGGAEVGGIGSWGAPGGLGNWSSSSSLRRWGAGPRIVGGWRYVETPRAVSGVEISRLGIGTRRGGRRIELSVSGAGGFARLRPLEFEPDLLPKKRDEKPPLPIAPEPAGESKERAVRSVGAERDVARARSVGNERLRIVVGVPGERDVESWLKCETVEYLGGGR